MLSLFVTIAAGILAGFHAYRLPMSGKAALILTSAPVIGVWLTRVWC